MKNGRVTQRDLYEIINDFRKEINDRFDNLEECFVSQGEFKPVKACVYGMVGIILTAVVMALLKQVISSR